MRIPYVIDNIEYQLAEVLNYLLARQQGQDVDIATAYFSIHSFALLRHSLPTVRCFRLMLGDDPQSAQDIGLRPDSRAFLRRELNAEPLREDTQCLVEEIIRFLRRDDVQIRLYHGHEADEKGRRRFLHAKCYLFYGARDGQASIFNRFTPLVGIVGSIQPQDRVRIVEAFAPDASGQPHLKGTNQEVDILIATDVMSEGQNLHDCGYLINYDLHWNPTRMVQRAGRIDRLGSLFEVLTSNTQNYVCFPAIYHIMDMIP